MAKPLAIDLYCGLGGWTEGLLAEGWEVIGFDIERHDYGSGGYPSQLVLMDTRQIHGAMFACADLIVASPPCQEFSYRAMPWKRAKALPPPVLGTNLFWQCWRIQNEAIEATEEECPNCADWTETLYCGECEGSRVVYRYIPLVVENVKGAQPWVGRAKGRYGSFYLWGDVESVGGRLVRSGPVKFGMASVAAARRVKVEGFNFHQHENGGKGGSFQSAAVAANVGKNPEGRNQKQPVWFNDDKRRAEKCGGDWFGSGTDCSLMRRMSSKSSARKAASAQIAKIPEPLSRHIARVFKPDL